MPLKSSSFFVIIIFCYAQCTVIEMLSQIYLLEYEDKKKNHMWHILSEIHFLMKDCTNLAFIPDGWWVRTNISWCNTNFCNVKLKNLPCAQGMFKFWRHLKVLWLKRKLILDFQFEMMFPAEKPVGMVSINRLKFLNGRILMFHDERR